MTQVKEQCLLSVIVPVYNVEPYLKKCIESIIGQEYSNLEILLIDDGSTDGSAELCDTLSKEDRRIKVFHKENGGLSSARNYGLDRAKGDWIAFLDSDDWVEKSMYKRLIETAIYYDVDIASCGVNYVKENNINNLSFDGSIALYDINQIIMGLKTQEKIRFEVWNKVWKKDIIGDTRFILGQVSEDVHWDRILFMKAGKLVFINDGLYNYRVGRPGSTATSFRKNRMCVFDEFSIWADELMGRDLQNEANIIKSISMRFAIIIYEEAYRSGQSRALLEELYAVFLHLYKYANTISDKQLAVLFKLAPKLYCKYVASKRK